MMCRFSRPSVPCRTTKVSCISYSSSWIRTNLTIHQTYNDWPWNQKLLFDEVTSRGTTKYSYAFSSKLPTKLIIKMISETFPHMLYEGHGCIYGGLYIINKLLSKYEYEFSSCTPSIKGLEILIPNYGEIVLVIIYYGGYSPQRLIFNVQLDEAIEHNHVIVPVSLTQIDEAKVHGTAPYLKGTDQMLTLESNWPDFRKTQYFHISLKNENTAMNVRFNAEDRDSCVYCTVTYAPHVSNIKGRQFDVEISNKTFERRDLIKSVFINISSCNVFSIPTWSVFIYEQRERDDTLLLGMNIQFLAHFLFVRSHWLESQTDMPPAWLMVDMIRPVEIEVHAIWRVWIQVCDVTSQVFLEVVLVDKHRSTLVYRWDHNNTSDDVYMTIDEAVNVLFLSDGSITCGEREKTFSLWFKHYHNQRTQHVSRETPEQSPFTFHRLR